MLTNFLKNMYTKDLVLELLILSIAVGTSMNINATPQTIYEGHDFELKCSTVLQYPVVWCFQYTDVAHQIFLGGEISKAFKEMFRLTGNQSVGEYNLLIASADSRYAGNYRCIDDEGEGPNILSIQLVILTPPSTTENRQINDLTTSELTLKDANAATSNSQNLQSNSTIVFVAVGGSVVLMIVTITIIVIVKRRALCMKPAGVLIKDAELSIASSSPSDSSITPLIVVDPRKKSATESEKV